MDLNLNYYSLAGLANFLSNFILGWFGFLGNPSSKLNRVWLFLSTAVASWGLGYFFWLSSKDTESALFWCRVLQAGPTFIPALFVHFFGLLVGSEHWPLFHKLRRPCYLISSAFFLVNFTPWMFSGVAPRLTFPYWPQPGTAYPAYTVYFIAIFIVLPLHAVLHWNELPADLRPQVKCFSTGATIGAVGAMTNFFLFYGIKIPPIGSPLATLYVIIMAYGIFRHRLLGISHVIRRFALPVLGYCLLLAILAVLLVPYSKLFQAELGERWWLIPAGVLVYSLAFFCGPLLFTYVKHRTELVRNQLTQHVTHEFKSPLASIQSATAILKDQLEKLPEGIRAKQADYLLMIQNNTQRLEKFIQDLLEVARIEETRPELRREEVDLNEVCERVVRVYGPQAEEKGLRLEFVPNGVDLVSCDPEKIQLVVSNLLSNAIKFTPQGSVRIEVNSLDHEVRVTVQDTGVGIPPEELPHIFERFYQGRNGQTVKGSGLGLSIVKGWVEAHGGRVWGESGGTGMGTMLTLTLPKKV